MVNKILDTNKMFEVEVWGWQSRMGDLAEVRSGVVTPQNCLGSTQADILRKSSKYVQKSEIRKSGK